MMAETDKRETNLVSRIPRSQWRKLCKKNRRKRIRQKAAQDRDQSVGHISSESCEDSPEERRHLAEQELVRTQQHEAWMERERTAQQQWKDKQARLQEIKEANECKARERWRSEKEEERKKLSELKRHEPDVQSSLLLQVLAGIDSSRPTHNPSVPQLGKDGSFETRPGVQVCPFFDKTGCCRFGDGCSRNHVHALISRTLLLEDFYRPLGVRLSRGDMQCQDEGLEYDDDERRARFVEFFCDVAQELRRCGDVVELKVCNNEVRHLRGNVYVQYSCENEAARAFALFNGRWYAGRQINARFVSIKSWNAAVCGSFRRDKCPKGGSCNFLHVLQNPLEDRSSLYSASARRAWQRSSRDNKRSSNHDISRSRFDSTAGNSVTDVSPRSYPRRSPKRRARRSRRSCSGSSDACGSDGGEGRRRSRRRSSSSSHSPRRRRSRRSKSRRLSQDQSDCSHDHSSSSSRHAHRSNGRHHRRRRHREYSCEEHDSRRRSHRRKHARQEDRTSPSADRHRHSRRSYTRAHSSRSRSSSRH